MKKNLCILFLVFSILANCSEYDFKGRHYLASYTGCDAEALNDSHKLSEVMEEAALAAGASILDSAEHHFIGGGFTQVLLLSESHASIHTYPECQACFIDLFTCGDCVAEAFDQILRAFLKPKTANLRVFIRDQSIREDFFHDKN